MKKQIMQSYLRNTHSVILPEEKGQDNMRLAATVAANFANLGYAMSKDTLDKLSHADRDDIIKFYKDNMSVLQDMKGVGFGYEPFYPDFPEEVIQKDRLRLFVDQVIYYISGERPEPSPALWGKMRNEFPFIGIGRIETLREGSEQDYNKHINQIMKSQKAWSPSQVKELLSFVQYGEGVERLLPQSAEMDNHENKVVLTCILEDHHKGNSGRYITTPTDILRYAAVRSLENDIEKEQARMSGHAQSRRNPLARSIVSANHSKGDEKMAVRTEIYKAANLRATKDMRPSYKLPRKTRKHVLEMIERVAGKTDLAAEMTQKKAEWKYLIRGLHISEHPEFKRTLEAFNKISRNQAIDRPQRRIEEAIKAKDLDAVLKELRERPGDFTRRFDKVFRMGIEAGRGDEVIGTLTDIASKAGIGAALSLAGIIQNRTKEEGMRYFSPPKSMKIFATDKKNREPLPKEYADRAVSAIKEALVERFRGKEPMGKVYISPEMKDIKVPGDMRNASEGLHTYACGSRIHMHSSEDWLRLFVSWTNCQGEHERVDNDLSCNLIDAEMKQSRNVAWNASYHSTEFNDDLNKSLKDEMYVYSGDITDGGDINGKGVAEYIDLNLPKLRENGIRYAFMNINSYTNQKFVEQPNTYFGFMFRNIDEAGKTFEPSTVQERYKLQGNGTQELAGIYDVEKDQLIFVDRQLNSRVATMSQSQVMTIFNQIESLGTLSLEDLVRANVEATNSYEVEDPSEADVLFVGQREMEEYLSEHKDFDFEGKTVVYPYDISYITGELMRDGQEQALEKENNIAHIFDEIMQDGKEQTGGVEDNERQDYAEDEPEL